MSTTPTEYKFYISPLIRITLSLLYIALTLPLPFLAQTTGANIAPEWLWIGIAIGFVALQGALSQRVVVSDRAIQVNYPRWIPAFFTKHWMLAWSDIQELKMRTTGQGGIVYYLIDRDGSGFLLPMRIAGFNKLVQLIAEHTNIDTQDLRPLAQPWMYLALLILTILLLIVDVWTIATAINLSITQ
jgi:hypothetical protein